MAVAPVVGTVALSADAVVLFAEAVAPFAEAVTPFAGAVVLFADAVARAEAAAFLAAALSLATSAMSFALSLAWSATTAARSRVETAIEAARRLASSTWACPCGVNHFLPSRSCGTATQATTTTARATTRNMPMIRVVTSLRCRTGRREANRHARSARVPAHTGAVHRGPAHTAQPRAGGLRVWLQPLFPCAG